ncbi:hypothetical protein GLOIN_2v764233 [Rhizophagus irregularis DAOM 181602=DAOM 197198]|nr:hypothetical protein GLOIN_2v764233 [Rhizophagus irregularis DAOM 181602=DAOM 197198]
MFIFDEDLLLSTLAKSRFFFVVPLLPFTSVFFTLLKPNFKTDPISKVPLLPFTSIHTDVIHPTMMIQQV